MQRVTGECLPCIPAQWELNDRTSISLSKHCRGPDIAFPVVTVGIVSPFPLNPLQSEIKYLSSKRLLRKARFGSGNLIALALKLLRPARERRVSSDTFGRAVPVTDRA